MEADGRKETLIAAQKSFFDHSSAPFRCKSKTRPPGSDSWICGRSGSLRMSSEKILIRAQSAPFRVSKTKQQDRISVFTESRQRDSLQKTHITQ
jgi:hypothetical protein